MCHLFMALSNDYYSNFAVSCFQHWLFFVFFSFSRLRQTSVFDHQLSVGHIYLSIDQACKFLYSCLGFLFFPRSPVHLRNTFSEIILQSLTLNQESSDHEAQFHSLLLFQPCFSFYAPSEALFLGR